MHGRTKKAKRGGRVVAITGGGNFLGSQLAARFDGDPDCARVVVLDAHSSIASSDARHYDVDIARPGADARLAEALRAEGVDTLVHTAFVGAPTRQTDWLHELESIGTMNVLSACAASPVRRLVVWSHTFLYGARPDNPALLPETWALRADRESPFLCNKLEVEDQVKAFAERVDRIGTAVLRTAPIVGPNSTGVASVVASHRVVPTVAGFDPLIQVVHEYDVVEAFKRVVDTEAIGVFNIVAEGVLPLSTAILLIGKIPLPVPGGLLRPLLAALWTMRLSEASASFADYLRYPCVADGSKAASTLGFTATFTTQEALCDFAARATRTAGPVQPPARDTAGGGR